MASGRTLAHSLTRTVRDPLFIFVIIGAACFWLFETLADERDVIAISEPLREQLQEDFQLLEGRMPTAAESDTLLQRFIRHEIMFREALDRGLHLDDPRLRQALIDKMRFLLADPADDPRDEDLVQFYADNMDRYYSERRLSFHNLFFSTEPEDPDAMLAALRNGAELLGEETFWMGGQVIAHHASVVRTVLGNEIYRTLRELEPGAWAGPLRSSRGYHFVRLDADIPPSPLRYQDVRQRVAEDWAIARQEASIERAVSRLAEEYVIREY